MNKRGRVLTKAVSNCCPDKVATITSFLGCPIISAHNQNKGPRWSSNPKSKRQDITWSTRWQVPEWQHNFGVVEKLNWWWIDRQRDIKHHKAIRIKTLQKLAWDKMKQEAQATVCLQIQLCCSHPMDQTTAGPSTAWVCPPLDFCHLAQSEPPN